MIEAIDEKRRTIGEIVGDGQGTGIKRSTMDSAAWMAIHGVSEGNKGFGIGYGDYCAGEFGVDEIIATERAKKIDPVYGGDSCL